MTTIAEVMMNELIIPWDTKKIIERELERDVRLKSVHTRENYKRALVRFEDWRAGRFFGKLLVEEYLAILQKIYKPATVNQHLAAIRWYVRRLADLAHDNDMPKDVREDILRHTGRIASIRDVTGERVAVGREISLGEMTALLKVCEIDPSPAGVRDGAIFTLVALTGLRRNEIIELNLSDFQPDDNGDGVLIIRGKGDRERRAFVYNGASLALVDWLLIRGHEAGPLFCVIRKGGELQITKRLGRESLRKILIKRLEQAGIDDLTWHDFRRTFAGNLLDEGVDLVTVQKLMGHSSPITTSRYDRRGERVQRKAVQKLFVPYQKRSDL